ncbi:LysR family transcriptional regulator [Stakelama sp. CBK3Z-3]|uniref:LysR family transcriptional regulator n=1 Tax=Stakelama flava TaxID=2860338 RepID=A0ABS6XNM9_9SPHN|nr:LysR family transcriptional regulator [Stakelama flava]MBW4331814.1 LysR family transcriptional regulator [Stakelama flava]
MELASKGFTGRVSDNDLRLLRTFCTVVRHGGFAAAESELQIGLPSISRYIKDLEVRLGMRLCDRGRRGFMLTAEGRKVHEACKTLFDNLAEFENCVRDIHANPAGALRIGMVDSLVSDPQCRLSETIQAYKRDYPNVTFRIVTETSNLIEQKVLEGELDIGVVFERRRLDQLVYHLMYEELSLLYCSTGHPLWADHGGDVSKVDLSQYELAGYPMAQLLERMGVGGIFSRTATADHMESIAMMINSDVYLGFLAESYVDTLWCRDRFRTIAPDTFRFTSKISTIARAGTPAPLISAFMKRLARMEPVA